MHPAFAARRWLLELFDRPVFVAGQSLGTGALMLAGVIIKPLAQISSVRQTILGIAAMSWVCLWFWSQSAFADILNHGDWTNAGLLQTLCAVPNGMSYRMAFSLSVVAWILMVLGMMLPLSIPVVEDFSENLHGRLDCRVGIFGFIAGYLGVALVFGALFHLAGYLLGQVAAQNEFLIFNGWSVGAFVFAIAGLFQFSATKAYFADQSCRRDYDVILGDTAILSGLTVGLRHGFFCFMGCWALMCLMFIFWTGSFMWVLCISGLMMVERRALRFGSMRSLVGVALLLCAVFVTTPQLI